MISNNTFLRIFIALWIALACAASAFADKNLDSTTFEVKKGVDLARQLEYLGINRDDARSAVDELNNIYNISKIPPGQQVKVNFEIMDSEGRDIRFSSMEMKISHTEKIQVNRLDNDIFFAHIFESTEEPKLMYVHATAGSELFSSATKAGISHEMFNELVKAYSYDVDFQRDVEPGSEMEVLYEGLYNEEGKLIGSGDILYSSLNVTRGKFAIYQYTGPDGQTDFYTEDGRSVQKSLLRTPVNGAHISSGYGTRMHPILGFSKMHKGVDFSAPKGTPVYAAGDGVILEMENKGSYGKYVLIYHDDTYSTAYAHLNGFARNLKRGVKVTQGQIIAYVGSTGRSTGPHLHYEIIKKGHQVNPLTVSLGTGRQLAESERQLFFKYRDSLLATVMRMSRKSQPQAFYQQFRQNVREE